MGWRYNTHDCMCLSNFVEVSYMYRHWPNSKHIFISKERYLAHGFSVYYLPVFMLKLYRGYNK